MQRSFILIWSCAFLSIAGCAHHMDKKRAAEEMAPAQEASAPAPNITVGNGENNYIVLDGITRDGATFTVTKVVIDQPGWLVIHPFENGAPAQTVYVGATLLPAGVSENVAITIDTEPMSGDKFVIMLHYDVNEDGVFDFNDGITVPDAPVFEGNTLVALRFEAP